MMLFLTGFMLIATLAYAGNGDLIVDGKLGVGTGIPGYKLDIATGNADGIKISRDTDIVAAGDFEQLLFSTRATGDYLTAIRSITKNAYGTGLYLNPRLGFFVQNTDSISIQNMTEKMSILGNGNVGIGTSDPLNRLSVFAGQDIAYSAVNAATWAVASISTPYGHGVADRASGLMLSVGNYNGSDRGAGIVAVSTGIEYAADLAIITGAGWATSSERARFTSDGKTLINRTTDDGTGAKLQVSGGVSSNGVLLTSDAKFKKNLLPINDSLEKVLGMKGLSYEWKTDEYIEKSFPEGRHYGVIAQQIEKVLPEVVNTAPDGTKAVAYTEIIPVLIEAIKEQQKQIDELKKRLVELQK